MVLKIFPAIIKQCGTERQAQATPFLVLGNPFPEEDSPPPLSSPRSTNSKELLSSEHQFSLPGKPSKSPGFPERPGGALPLGKGKVTLGTGHLWGAVLKSQVLEQGHGWWCPAKRTRLQVQRF